MRRLFRCPIDCLVCWLSFCFGGAGAIVTPALLAAFPLPAEAIQAMCGAFETVDPAGLRQSVASTAEFVRSFVPGNPVRAAAHGAVLQVMIFGLVFARAVRGGGGQRPNMDRYDALRGLSRIQPSRPRTAPDRAGGPSHNRGSAMARMARLSYRTGFALP